MKDRIIKALENEKYLWRTINGIHKETDIETEKILKFLKGNDEIVSTTTNDGKDLYTTRNHFRKKANFREKLYGAIKGKLA